MTRIEELTFNLADESFSQDDGRELEHLLAQDQRGRQIHIAILDLEARLRAKRENLGLTGRIMKHLRERMAESIAQEVMSKIRKQPFPEWLSQSRRGKGGGNKPDLRNLKSGSSKSPFAPAASSSNEARRSAQGGFGRFRSVTVNRQRLKPVLLALAACVVLMAGCAFWLLGPTMGEPVLAEVDGAGVSIDRASHYVMATTGLRLRIGDVLRTPATATAGITFTPEQTRIILEPNSELKFVSVSRGKRFMLRTGQLAATVARQHPLRPMVMLTAQARVTVVGTEFTLIATTNSTRLDVFDGVVRFAKLSDGHVVRVTGGSFAVAQAATNLALQPISGKVLREVWLDLPGNTLQDLTYSARYPSAPSTHDFPSSFETNTNQPSAFGTRTRGYLVPPSGGDYEFYIDGIGQIGLWLSPDEDPVDKVKIAQIAFTRNRPGDPAPTETHSRQESGPVSLEAGRRYYIEAIHKYGDSQDRLTVSWKRPDGTLEPIPAEFLAPFKSQSVKKHR